MSNPVLSGSFETKEKSKWYFSACKRFYGQFSKRMSQIMTPLFFHRVFPVFFILQMFLCSVFGVFIVLPYLYDGYTKVILLSQQLTAILMFLEIFANWLCIRYVDCSYRSSELHEICTLPGKELCQEDASLRSRKQTNGTIMTDEQDKPAILHYPYWSWTPCLSCGIPERPPRCHHCPLCKVCVLKRDHHCYFAGSCVGSRNLRHFVVFLFWSIYALVYSLVHGMAYYCFVIYHESALIDLIPFVVFIRRALGYDIKLYYGILDLMGIALIYMTLICSQHFIDMLFQIPDGRTSFEIKTHIFLQDKRNSVWQKIRSVFGDYSMLNFVLPVHMIFPEDEDPIHWPTISGTKNNAYVKIGSHSNKGVSK